MLRRAAGADPAKAAVAQGDKRVRYDELEALAGRCAAGLRRIGVGGGDCVSVALPNGAEFVACLFACARLGAVMSPLNPQSPREELLGFVADARARVVVTDASGERLLAGTDAAVVRFDSLLLDRPDPPPRDASRGPVLYLYTSGSTDSWKRLCCTQENLFYEAHNFVETAALTADDNILCTIPLYHSYGLGNCLLDAVYAGATLVLPEPDDAPFSARCAHLPDLIRREAVRFYPGVPYQFQILADLPADVRPAIAGLKLCVSSGDVLPRQTYEQFLRRFGQPIRSLYGSTEAGSISVDLGPPETLEFGSLGPPLANVDVRIRDEAGRELPPGESGEIWVKSPVIPPTGYDNRPDLTAEAFRDGYFNTGDVGKKDARGYLVMTGRKQTFVEVGGRKVDLGEVEEVLRKHPRVREAAALGVDVPHLGTLIKAVVVADGARDEAGVRAHCRAALAPFKVPRMIEFRDALPRSPVGKVLKSELGDVSVYLNTMDGGGFEDAWLAAAPEGPARQVELLADWIRDQAALTLQCEPGQVGRSKSFNELGFDSLQAAELDLRLTRVTGLQLSITLLWNYPSIDELAKALWSRMTANATGGRSDSSQFNGGSPPPLVSRRPAGAPTVAPAGGAGHGSDEVRRTTRGATGTPDAKRPAARLDALLDEVEALSESDVDASFGRTPDERPPDKRPTDKRPTDERPPDERPPDERPTAHRPAEGERR